MISPESIWNLLWVNENFSFYSLSPGFLTGWCGSPATPPLLFPDCRGKYEVMGPLWDGILAWRIPWREEPGRLQSMGSQRVGHEWATSLTLLSLWDGMAYFLSSCQIQIFELSDLLAQELVERTVSMLTHSVSELQSCSKKKPNRCVRMKVKSLSHVQLFATHGL